MTPRRSGMYMAGLLMRGHADMTADQRTAANDRRVTVTRSPGGWLLQEEDAGVVRERLYTDWHRVERAIRTFETSSAAHSTKR
jgi:hypothetical protein